MYWSQNASTKTDQRKMHSMKREQQKLFKTKRTTTSQKETKPNIIHQYTVALFSRRSIWIDLKILHKFYLFFAEYFFKVKR